MRCDTREPQLEQKFMEVQFFREPPMSRAAHVDGRSGPCRGARISLRAPLSTRATNIANKGRDHPALLHTSGNATTRVDQGSANTFSTPESFGMLFQGSPHRSP